MDEPARTGGGERATDAPAEGPLGQAHHTPERQRDRYVWLHRVTASAGEPFRTADILYGRQPVAITEGESRFRGALQACIAKTARVWRSAVSCPRPRLLRRVRSWGLSSEAGGISG